MSNEVKHPGRVGLDRVNDFENNGHPDPRDPEFRWNGNNDIRRRKQLSSACLAAISEAARSTGRALTDEERTEIIAQFQ
jgi:hypothetical protein